MAKVASRNRSGAYFRFPLALLTLTDDPADFWQTVTSWTAVDGGSHRAEKIGRGEIEASDDYGDPFSSGAELAAWVEIERPGLLPNDYDSDNPLHVGIAVAVAPGVVKNFREGVSFKTGGMGLSDDLKVNSAAYTVRRYREALAHVEAQAKATGGRSPNVTLRGDFLRDIKSGRISWAEAKVLCAVYSAVGKAQGVTVSYPQIRARADGYRSVKAFEAAAHARGAVPSADVPASALAPVPSAFKRSRRKSGLLRYDEAVGYLRLWGTDDDRTLVETGHTPAGENGVCDVIPTPAGVLFKLRPEFMPPEGARMKTGSHHLDTIYTDGERVLYALPGADGLFVGTVAGVDHWGLDVERNGETSRLRRAESYVTPVTAAPELAALAALAEAGTGETADVPEPSLSTKRVRKITADLGRLRFYTRVSLGDGKGWAYSIKGDEDEIIDVIATRLDYKAVEKERSQRTQSKLAARLAEREAERAAKQAKVDAIIERRRAEREGARASKVNVGAEGRQRTGRPEGRDGAGVREALPQEKRAQRRAFEQAPSSSTPPGAAFDASRRTARVEEEGSFIVPGMAPKPSRETDGNAQRAKEGEGPTPSPPSPPASTMGADLFGPPALRSTARTGRLGGVGLAEQDEVERPPAPTPTELYDGRSS